MRSGIGYDVHRFGGTDRRLVLGGVEIEGEAGLAGHSDADAVTHAVMDALLGAAGKGDIGEHFPDDDPGFEGADSIELLGRVVRDLVGWRVVNVDVTVIAERPRLTAHKRRMADRLAGALKVDASCVNVKATTSEGMGPIGRGEGIAALAVAQIDKTHMTEAIRIHDSLTGGVRELRVREPGKVGIYACGPTVYGRIHVGNARPYVVFALLKRFLEHEGYDVTLVENITDVNDKIYDAARAAGVPSEQLAREMADAYRVDTDRLGLGRPDHEPLASATIDGIIDLIAALIERGHAYPAGGDVYFSVRSHEEYGKLSNRRLEDLIPADQGEPDTDQGSKRDPLDFALWKAQKPGEDTAWDSPWGRGRPGWHIECSAMAEAILGLDFDIHGGGSDLMFPHHENEIAQTEAGRGRPLARLWMHNGMIRFGEEKMAKSVGNVATLADALEGHGRDALIVYLLGGHYRQPLAFSTERLEEARQSSRRLADFARLVHRSGDLTGPGDDPHVRGLRDEFLAALRDDFNTPEALAALFKLVSEGNRRLAAGEALPGGAAVLEEMLAVLGLETLFAGSAEADEVALRLAREREEARLARDFDRADAVRDELLERGWEVRDTPEGPVLVPAAG